jgi:class 3 adenylate cyclase
VAIQTSQQLLPNIQGIVDTQLATFRTPRTVSRRNTIPDTSEIPGSNNPEHWLRIPDIVCVFVDMKGSTQLSATTHDKGTAGAYQLFTDTAVRIFHEFRAPYIDVRGDGVFALFNSDQAYRCFAAALTFKTFAHRDFTPAMKGTTGLEIGAHIGIDQKTVLVHKLGLKPYNGRTDRQNEVWAGKPVNMASKLAAAGDTNQLIVSDRYFKSINNDLIVWSCGCEIHEDGVRPSSTKRQLWSSRNLLHDPKFDFDMAHVLEEDWCPIHGQEYCEAILALDPS